MAERDYYYPLLFLVPDFYEDYIEHPPYRLAKRKWDTSIFDLATLQTQHKLHLSSQAMGVFLSRCNLELCIMQQQSVEEATAKFQGLRLSLYAGGMSPFLSPFITTHSINDYSGINSRDSELLREKLPPELQHGLRSDDDTVEAWPFELSFQCIVLSKALGVSTHLFGDAAAKARRWRSLTTTTDLLQVVEDAANSAPKLTSLDQSILHIWTALEALFPDVAAELSFRIAIYLAQLNASSSGNRLSYYEKVRGAYTLRSKIAHGSKRSVTLDKWKEAWTILIEAVNAVVNRGKMPSEKELLAELLS